MDQEPGYRPIACDFHDRLEELATLRRRVRLSLASAAGNSGQDRGEGPDGGIGSGSGKEEIRMGSIEDIYTTESKEEFLRLDDGTAIRLDRILSVEETP